MDELIKEFVQESTENLDRLDQDFVKLESDPNNLELLKSIFRAIHTVKGTCGFLGFTRLEALTHAGESLLSLLREGELTLSESIANALLEMVDAVRKCLRTIEATGTEGEFDSGELIDKLKDLQQRGGTENQNASLSAEPSHALGTTCTEPEPGAQDTVPVEHPMEVQKKESATETVQPSVPLAIISDQKAASKQIDEQKEATIRVDVDLLDRIINQVSELVLVRNRLLQLAAKQKDNDLKKTVQGLNLLTTELRKYAMKARLQPVSNLFDRFPRIVRDTAQQCGKKIRLETVGGDTELDKTLLEAIKDPVTHIIRNSVDHGIETPEIRRAAGKPEEGTISLRAYHEGGHFYLELKDDGAGIDLERLKKKAVERQLISSGQAANLSEEEALQLVFLPGLSTAKTVSNISGRGVGMDVVSTNIGRIGGTVSLVSKVGIGTTLLAKIPLTLATIPALIISSGGHRFAIPQAALVELVRLDAERSRKSINRVDDSLFYRLRDRVIPLLRLNLELRLEQQNKESDANMLVLRAGGSVFGLVVDHLHDSEEIVVKPLGEQLKDICIFSGATVLGDGKVALILDVPGLARRANAISETADALADRGTTASREGNSRLSLLLLEGPENIQVALPLSLVKRLEEFPRKAFERLGEIQVVQYREDILPLVDIAHFVGRERITNSADEDPEERIPCVVYANSVMTMGLRADRIKDIVNIEKEAVRPLKRKGFMGSVVVQNKVTEILDLEKVIADLHLEELIRSGESEELAGART